jgi:hypothetical protein
LSLRDQQLLAEEEDLAVLVTQGQAEHQRIEGCKEQQVGVMEHSGERRRGGREFKMEGEEVEQEGNAHLAHLTLLMSITIESWTTTSTLFPRVDSTSFLSDRPLSF